MIHTTQTPVTAVLAAAGAQGSHITTSLKAVGAAVRPLTRREAPLEDVNALTRAVAGSDTIVYTAPLDYSDTAVSYATNVTSAAAAAGVGRIVYNTNTRIPETMTDAQGFETRRAAVQTLTNGPVPVVIVEPAIYIDNLRAPGVLRPDDRGDGLVLQYPTPADTPISWISLADLGRTVAAAAVHARPGDVLQPGTTPIFGAELAATIAGVLDEAVRFEPLDPQLFEQGLATALGAGAAAGVASIYYWLHQNPDSTVMCPDPARQPLWMPPPSPISTWVAENLVASHHD